MIINGFEVTARQIKADKLAALLVQYGISVLSARRMTETQWAMAAKKAGCKPPTSELTRQAVYTAMRDSAADSRMTVAEWRDQVEAQLCQS